MDINFRGSDWPPIYFDPEFDEILELTKSFDTLRCGIHLEKGKHYLVIASGLGNTHSSLSRAIGEMNPRGRLSRIDGLKYGGLDGTFIIYEEQGKLWFNMCDYGGEEKVAASQAISQFPVELHAQLRDIVNTASMQRNHIAE
jgi:hypothetical protein